MTFADLSTDAATAHLDALADVFAAPPLVVRDGAMPRRPMRVRTEPAVQRQMRLDGHQVAWLDEQVTRVGAPSRNAFIVALLRAHLGQAA